MKFKQNALPARLLIYPATPRPSFRGLTDTMKSAAELLMERETRVEYGPVPRMLFGDAVAETSWQMLDDEFLLRGEGDHYFLYRRGKGITVERGSNADLSEESLWLDGTVYAAIASMNGLLPIHASAVAHNGRVFAFSGPAGAGKSTLTAALANYGLPMFCDDTLVLDLADSQQIVCLPGHKRLKLRPDALPLTGAHAEERVSKTVDKFYARPLMGGVGTSLPLALLIFLEEGQEMAIRSLLASDRLTRIQDDHQTARLFAHASRFDRKAEFAHRLRLAKQIKMARFTRPRRVDLFPESVALAAQYVTEWNSD